MSKSRTTTKAAPAKAAGATPATKPEPLVTQPELGNDDLPPTGVLVDQGDDEDDDQDQEVTDAQVREMLDDLDDGQRDALRRGLTNYHREGADLREIAGFDPLPARE